MRATPGLLSLAGTVQSQSPPVVAIPVQRYLDSADVAFEIPVSIHPADRFTFSMEMNRARE